MIKKTKNVFVCTQCGEEYPKWMGKCLNCNTWGCITEFHQSARKGTTRTPPSGDRAAVPLLLSSCKPEMVLRIKTGFPDIDRVLGGGLVPGSLVLVGGNPGIGKSTIVLQIADQILKKNKSVLYISGEESIEQVSLRSDRLGLQSIPLQIFSETNTERILEAVEKIQPGVIIIDSIQALYSEALTSAPGSVAQVRECAALLMQHAKPNQCTVLFIGHVTKDGAIAGPRVLEHMVDTVLYFEGDSTYQYRILRSVKNRFGPSGEIAVLEMTDHGLNEVSNVSEFFCMRHAEPQIGTAVVPVLEGSRVLVVELQALVNRTHFGLPQRVASGINPKKLSLIIAVLERYTHIILGDHDIFFNIASGLTIAEPAIDMGIAAAVVSSFRNKPIRKGLGCIGEIGLGGEVRPVNNMALRLRELASMGFKECIVPVPGKKSDWAGHVSNLTLIECKSIQKMGDYII